MIQKNTETETGLCVSNLPTQTGEKKTNKITQRSSRGQATTVGCFHLSDFIAPHTQLCFVVLLALARAHVLVHALARFRRNMSVYIDKERPRLRVFHLNLRSQEGKRVAGKKKG